MPVTRHIDPPESKHCESPVDGQPGRIAIFQAEWCLQSHTMNLARALVAEGYTVDIYLCDVDASLVDVSSATNPGLSIRTWESAPSAPRATRLSDVIATAANKSEHARRLRHLARVILGSAGEAREWLRLLLRSMQGLLHPDAIDAATMSVGAAPHLALIGVEKLGLIWAAEVARSTGVPFAYYSLELYTADHPWSQALRSRRIRWFEARAHRDAAATIVQDELRARVLLADTGADATRIVFLPVSVPGPARPRQSRLLHETLDLQEDVKVILQFGMIDESRFSVELAATAQHFHDDWVLVMHGRANTPTVVPAMRTVDRGNKVVLSTQMRPEEELPELLGSADVGLVFYGAEVANDRLTARSSEKLALYLRSGVPVVAFSYPGYEVISAYECGVLITDFAELPDALATILANRKMFSDNALRCFADHYDFSRLVPPVIQAMGHLRDQCWS